MLKNIKSQHPFPASRDVAEIKTIRYCSTAQSMFLTIIHQLFCSMPVLSYYLYFYLLVLEYVVFMYVLSNS